MASCWTHSQARRWQMVNQCASLAAGDWLSKPGAPSAGLVVSSGHREGQVEVLGRRIHIAIVV
eukprot:5593398-Karenia_brevis.AAC.1